MTYDELQKKTAELYASGEVYTCLLYTSRFGLIAIRENCHD